MVYAEFTLTSVNQKLAIKLVSGDLHRYYLNQVPLILGIVQSMLASCGVGAAAA